MIDTFAILKSKKQSGIQEVLPCRLVIAGITQDPTGKNRKKLQKKIDKEQLTSCITLTERISDQACTGTAGPSCSQASMRALGCPVWRQGCRGQS